MCFSATSSFAAGALLLGIGTLTPETAALSMSGSSAVVAFNALVLSRWLTTQ